MKIAILDDYQNEIKDLKCFKLLEGQDVKIINKYIKDPNQLAKEISDVEILVLIRERTTITEELLSRLPKLKLISQTGKISNHLDLNLCNKYKVAVAEGIGSPIAPAELTWALIMNTVRKIPQSIHEMKQGNWQAPMGETIYGKLIGIWGYGKIGKKIAQYARVFGAEVWIWGSENSMNEAIKDGFKRADNADDFFRKSDVVTVHLRLNDKTRGIIKEQDILKMKQDSCFINTARAELVEQNAIFRVLNSGKKMSFGFDVYDEEPVYDKGFKLLQHHNVVCTPHLGYVEKNSFELYLGKAFENILNYLKGQPANIANPDVLD